MTLGERIKACRQAAGLSQEKVAELVGVSRQAVTKWESGQSAPSTENLFRLAELFGTTTDLLLTDQTAEPAEPAAPETAAAEAVYALYKQEKSEKAAARRAAARENLRTALVVAAAYLAAFLAGKLACGGMAESSVLGWLTGGVPGNQAYLFGWLLSSRLYWAAMAVSVLAALIGRWRFALTQLGAFGLGLLAGELFGPNPAGVPYGQGHYGWAIWGGIMLAAAVAGAVWERRRRKS